MEFRKRSVPDLSAAPISSSSTSSPAAIAPCDLEMSSSNNSYGGDGDGDLEASARRTREPSSYDNARSQRQFTARAVIVGLAVGTIVCFSNMYFGLQSECPIKRGLTRAEYV
jgi:hypothetical protein